MMKGAFNTVQQRISKCENLRSSSCFSLVAVMQCCSIVHPVIIRVEVLQSKERSLVTKLRRCPSEVQ